MPKRFFICSALLVCISCHSKKAVQTPVDQWSAYRRAYTWLSSNKDSAFYYFNQVVISSRDHQQIVMALNNMSLIQSDAGDYFGSQESLLQSLNYLNRNDPGQKDAIASAYNELASASFNLKDYTAAIEADKEALSFASSPIFKATIRNNLAAAYRSTGQYHQALAIYRELIEKVPPNTTDYARIRTNLENTRWLQEPDYNAAPGLFAALHIRRRAKDTWGLSSSYAHLADFYRLRLTDSARHFAAAMYRTALRLGNPDEQLDALGRLVELMPDQQVRTYSLRYRILNDSLQTVRNRAKNQFALIRYQSEKRKLDNLNLSRDNTEKKYQLIREQFKVYVITILLILMVILGVILLKRRRRKSEQEKQEAIADSNQKASKKVHDTLANDLYVLMKTVQYQYPLEKEKLVDQLDNVYQRARDLSYTITGDLPDFYIWLPKMLMSFSSERTGVNITGNEAGLWQRVPPSIKAELRYVFQELMVNMQKHSGATDVVVRFEQHPGYGVAIYRDNGKGLNPGTAFHNGLTNAENRIKAIGGNINFESDFPEGLSVYISFPLS